MSTQDADDEKKCQEANPFPCCGDVRKMAEMMKSFCAGEGAAIACCPFMKGVTGQGTREENEEANETRKPEGGNQD